MAARLGSQSTSAESLVPHPQHDQADTTVEDAAAELCVGQQHLEDGDQDAGQQHLEDGEEDASDGDDQEIEEEGRSEQEEDRQHEQGGLSEEGQFEQEEEGEDEEEYSDADWEEIGRSQLEGAPFSQDSPERPKQKRCVVDVDPSLIVSRQRAHKKKDKYTPGTNALRRRKKKAKKARK
jgi:hypothetical protein